MANVYRRFEEFPVWQESRKLSQKIRAICKRPNVKRDFAFIDQITRAVRSISANIAEGAEANTHPQFIQFLGFAKRSAGEVRAHLYDALDESYISRQEFNDIVLQTETVGKMIGGFMRYLHQHPKKDLV